MFRHRRKQKPFLKEKTSSLPTSIEKPNTEEPNMAWGKMVLLTVILFASIIVKIYWEIIYELFFFLKNLVAYIQIRVLNNSSHW